MKNICANIEETKDGMLMVVWNLDTFHATCGGFF
jgi:hypothetical protein